MCGVPLDGWTRAPVCAECLDRVEGFAEPFRCARCGAGFNVPQAVADGGCCGACRRDPPAYDGLVAVGPYGGVLRRLIHLFKYDGIRPLARPLGDRLAAAAREAAADLVVPAPLHRARRWSRGFNQAELLARRVARVLGRPCEPRLLRRARATRPQAGLSRRERGVNVAGAFVAPRPERLAGRAVLLVDDVTTTGATLEACARALKRGGAARVTAAALARADLEARTR